jgi:preprotein translocase subunit SecA
MLSILKNIFSTSNDKILRKLKLELKAINALEADISKLSDQGLKDKTLEFKQDLKNKTIHQISHQAFAVVREASKRVLGMRHFDEQIIGGLVLSQGMISEMQTGEGKTLTSTLPGYLYALTGKGVHMVTVNDYLVKRDSDWMGEIYKSLGISIGCVLQNSSNQERKKAYECDIIYITNNELGFDYLKDNMKMNLKDRVQRDLYYAIIDEVDSILIDESRTPLVISGAVDDDCSMYEKVDKVVRNIEEKDFVKDDKIKNVHLTDEGLDKIEALLTQQSLIKTGTSLYDMENMHIVHYVNQSLKSHTMFNKDVDYIIRDQKLMIVDEFTGRVLESRRYSDGLHQALEVKEGLEVQKDNQTLASITFQNYFKIYQKISGMTGTAQTEANEFKDIYNLSIVSIPTHKKSIRKDHDDVIYGTSREKYQAILELVTACYSKGQPILIGTVSIEKSEEISAIFKENHILHDVLNAKNHAQEARIIAEAGQFKKVTIATNMAGRGTDIVLGGTNASEQERSKVLEVGGLFVMGTERHESRRIDDQLRGRCGRQGDPGETKFFLSLEDDLMKTFTSDRMSNLMRTIGLKDGEAVNHSMINNAVARAQKKMEAHHYDIRKTLLKFDDVMNKQRNVVYVQRLNIIKSGEVLNRYLDISEEILKKLISSCIPENTSKDQWDVELFVQELDSVFNLQIDQNYITESKKDIKSELIKTIKLEYEKKIQAVGEQNISNAIKYVLITSIDHFWKDHLHSLDQLRSGISFRSYGQKDPLNEYSKESLKLFEDMLYNIKKNFIIQMSRLNVSIVDERELKQPSKKSGPASGILRNSPCHCGSGKKYKHCHGKF